MKSRRLANGIVVFFSTMGSRIRNWKRRNTLKRFITEVQTTFPNGTVISNPGGGTSTIAGLSDSTISYVRGNSAIVVGFSDLFDAYTHYKGRHVTSSDLRAYRPVVFDSAARPAGHSCNCTFLFRVLEALNLSGPITGSGVRGNPFGVDVH